MCRLLRLGLEAFALTVPPGAASKGSEPPSKAVTLHATIWAPRTDPIAMVEVMTSSA
jgi:hypothetical protein